MPIGPSKLKYDHLNTSGMVYEDAEKLYGEVGKDCQRMLEDAFAALYPRSLPLSRDQTTAYPTPGSVMGINTTHIPRLDVVQIPMSISDSRNFRSQVVQSSSDGKHAFVLLENNDGFGISSSRGIFADCQSPSG